jgi:hypothetical protein
MRLGMKPPPNVTQDLLDVPLCNLPRLARPFVAKMEDAGYVTIGDCLRGWSILATCDGTWRTRHPKAPKHIGRAFLRQLRLAFAECERVGAPEADWREDDPTPSEIRERAAEMRRQWDALRWQGYAGKRVELMVVTDPRGNYVRGRTDD